ncbi:MAG: DUF3172 domain-containing protein [Leptolyngbyaceae cyanobacterium MO_188.B28]|nr:DUF3172 domain-containing protein [Leptolyngbyaceae cyanobacterium MO_188.B28]
MASPPSSEPAFDLNPLTMAIVGGIFILGIVLGIVFSNNSTLSTSESVNSVIDFDNQAPNADICAKFGASALVSETRTFMTLDPKMTLISQPKVSWGCVIRHSNWAVLEQKGLLSSEDMKQCQNRLNTFGYTGDLNTDSEVNCLYQDKSRRF